MGSTAFTMARMLLDIGAVHFNAQTPYIFTSGWASPVYVDCRRVISFPQARRFIIAEAQKLLDEVAGPTAFDAIAGGETAGIPYAAWLADAYDLPMLYIRKKPKGFGRNAQIEGTFAEGARVLMVEDLATDGGSKLNFIQALRDAGARVEHTFVVFHYDIFPASRTRMAEMGVELHALVTWWDMLAAARRLNSFDAATLDAVEAFLNNPAEWSAAHGGASEPKG